MFDFDKCAVTKVENTFKLTLWNFKKCLDLDRFSDYSGFGLDRFWDYSVFGLDRISDYSGFGFDRFFCIDYITNITFWQEIYQYNFSRFRLN